MTQFLILKLEGDDPRGATITGHVIFDGEPEDAIKQGFVGEGRYAIVDWDERLECDLAQGLVEATAVEDKAVRESRAAEEAEAQVKA